MLPSFLYSTYRQYKEDTSYVVNWLAQTAKSRGYAFPPSTSTTTTPKLIPKKVIKNKKKALQAEQDRQAQQKPYTIPTKELLSLAQYISKCGKPPVTIPRSIISTIKRTIKARKQSNDYYATAEPDSDGNEGHAFFIRTLCSVLDVLKPADCAMKQARHGNIDYRDGTTCHETKEKSLYDMLSALDLEESDSEMHSSSGGNDQPAASDEEPPHFGVEPMAEHEKQLFAMSFLFGDIRKIIHHVSRLWEAYAAGRADLIAATVASECGIDLIQRLEQDFLREFPQVKHVQRLIAGFYPEAFTAETVIDQSLDGMDALLNATPSDSKATETLDRASYGLYPMYRRLSSFIHNLDLEAEPIYQPLPISTFNSELPRCLRSLQRQVREDDILFQSLTPLLHWEVAVLTHDTEKRPIVQDSFLRALRQLFCDKQMSLWLVAAGQCSLEAIHATWSVPDKALQETRAIGCAVKFSASIATDNPQSSEVNELIRDCVDEHTDVFMTVDWTHHLITKFLCPAEQSVPPPFCLLKQNPMECGMHALGLLENFHDVSVRYVNNHAAIISVAHLVNAVQQEQTCPVAWPELESMIKMQGEELIFVGGRPKTVEQYSSRYKLARGTSAVEFAHNRRSEGRVRSRREPRLLKHDLPTSSLLRRWWSSARGDLSLAHVERLLNESFEALSPEEIAQMADPLPAIDGLPLYYVGIRDKQPPKTGRQLQAKVRNPKSLTATEFLLALQIKMTNEMDMLKFDYLALHRNCWRLLELLAVKMDGAISAMFGTNWLGKERNLGGVVVAKILNSGPELSKLATRVMRARDAERLQNQFLVEAGAIVEDFLKELAKERKEGSVGQFDEAALSPKLS